MSIPLSYFSYSKLEGDIGVGGEIEGVPGEGEVGGSVVATIGEGWSSSKVWWRVSYFFLGVFFPS